MASAVVTAAVAACAEAPAAYGEALLVVHTDASIPRRVNRLRIDVIGDDGATLQSRELSAPSIQDWPISFSVVADREEERFVLVRLRAYAEGHTLTRAALAAARAASSTFSPPVVATTLEDACRDAPTLRLGQPLVVRRGSRPITTVLPFTAADGSVTCTVPTGTGSSVAKLVVTERDRYRVEVASSVPDGTIGSPGSDTTIAVRTDCRFATSQLACNDDLGGGSKLSRVTLELAPGTYWVVTGGADPAPADMTLLATQVNTAVQVPPPLPPVEDADALEPSPGATIDRLLRLRLAPGERGTLRVTLAGECFGATADLANRQTCVDRAGPLVPVDTFFTRGQLRREVAPPTPWSGEATVACTAAPRATGDALDGEVCVPGGAMLLGDTLALADLDEKSQPERTRIVEPFLMDVFEMTVGRFRDAIRRGLVPLPGGVQANNGPITVDNVCTWSEGPSPTEPAAGIDRETLPLNCVRWEQARAVCKFLAADLPTEDQWEYAATTADRPAETQYPWGDALPDCARVVTDRSRRGIASNCAGADLHIGPFAVDEPRFRSSDRTSLGIVGLGGNLMEWLSTGFYPYAHRAWESAGLRDALPAWANEEAPLRAVRGGDWAGFALFATGSARRALPPLARFDNLGFRCARPGR